MTQNEFMSLLADELRKRNIADAGDIVEEYQQHFAFKLADGYSEEEIAVKLGDPTMLAAQFEQTSHPNKGKGTKPLVVAGICFVDLFASLFFLLLVVWSVVMAACSLASAALAVCLFGGSNIYALIPPMPYWCGVIMALSFTALSVLIAVGCFYYVAFVRQLLRSFMRFQHNVLATVSGDATLPALSINPQVMAKTNRRLRSTALISLALFAACFVFGYIACSLSAGSLEFWHVWNWFGYAGSKLK